jgi:hypothetical protein
MWSCPGLRSRFDKAHVGRRIEEAYTLCFAEMLILRGKSAPYALEIAQHRLVWERKLRNNGICTNIDVAVLSTQ